MQYDQPTSNEDLVSALEDNPRTNAVLAAIESVLNTEGTETTIVGSWDAVGEPTSPGGEQPDLLVITPEGDEGDDVTVGTNSAVNGAPVLVFDTDANITFSLYSENYAPESLARPEGDPVYAAEIDRVIVLGNGDDNVSILVDSNTTINAGDGNDTIVTGGGDDEVILGEGNSTVSTGLGDDTVFSGFGADTVDGGEGYDMVVLEGTLEDYTVTIEDGQIVLVSNADEADSLTASNVEFIQLDDGQSIAIGATEDEADVLRLYQGLLGRSTDREGAQYWIENDLNGNELSVEDIAKAILATDEGSAINSLDDDAFIATMYENALGREASADEVAYWAADLANGADRGWIAAQIVGSPEAEDSIVNVKFIDGNV
ncbi:DUF4214 domain-containing protein [Verticiella sediminum]|uniref:DUF4214 domain-containing protein n=1 Tax=Verticiella sediminum TaxID=1247510 RepID=A0A556AWJ6_9BURK|nr:DUF4214 domain-containing protein [Verticiella sediminum]TSH97297.1 DUF4214 domain-containing protein [Verticiella sediminum]